MKQVRLFLGIAFLLLLLWVFYDYSLNHKISLIGFDEEPQSSSSRDAPWWQVMLSALALLLGILFGSLYERLKEKKGKVYFKGELSKALTSPHFFKAVLTAPIIFAGVYVATRSQPDLIVAFLFAFQNGFFCDAILRDTKDAEK